MKQSLPPDSKASLWKGCDFRLSLGLRPNCRTRRAQVTVAIVFVFSLFLSLFASCADVRSGYFGGPCSEPEGASGFNGGDGMEESPFVICTYAQFDRIREDMEAHYRLGQDIDTRASWLDNADSNYPSCLPYEGTTPPGVCPGFRPFDRADFKGGLDGQGFVIRELYSDRIPRNQALGPSSVSGMIFRKMTADAYLRNLGIVNMIGRFGSIGGSDTWVAILVGILEGSIDNSYILGGSFKAPSGSVRVSAFVARSSGSSIRNSFTAIDGTLAPNTVIAGGLVASSPPANGGSIVNSYSRVNVRAEYQYAGGIAGDGRGISFRNVYSTGRVQFNGTAKKGGIVGQPPDSSSSFRGTNYYTSGVGQLNCTAQVCSQLTLAELRAISSLPSDWSAEDWDLRGSEQVPALKYGGGPSICGTLCGQLIPNQPD